MPNRTLRIPPDLLAAIEARAKQDGLSTNAYICTTLAREVGLPYTPPERGGDMLAARLKGVYISVANGTALVCQTVDGVTTPATNADDLAHFAALAVERRGSLSEAGIYACPPTLAKKAKW